MELEYTKEGKIAIFTLNRPEALSALSPTLFSELHDGLEDFKKDPELWVGVISDRVFFEQRCGRGEGGTGRKGCIRKSLLINELDE
jgi:1,4-dihydroxy-2-naphthoyl-CoA synthase